MVVKPAFAGNVTLIRFVQLRKAELPIVETLSGMIMPDSLLQLEKALSPIAVTVSGMIMPSSLLQPIKALFPMVATLLVAVKVTLSRPLQ